LLTPSYHVFEMYKVHQGAELVKLRLQTPEYRLGGESLPALHASASRDSSERVHLTMANLDPARPATVRAQHRWERVSGRVLTADEMQAHNTFDRPNAIQPAQFAGWSPQGDSTILKLPSKSVVVLRVDGA
jgi:alpha-N-arabinofuranosidase